ncbi:hypothetical protein PG993_012631 [Apiospora rasikravindrae]|uniref:Uncharacterized protein n=1 Tax=Apiospora rasikravindrae TaxID=990691 RepID=A0ABR1S355_9PEZI
MSSNNSRARRTARQLNELSSELSKHWEEPLGPRRHTPFSASRSPSASTAHSPRKASIPTLQHAHSRSQSQSHSQSFSRDDTPSAAHPPSRPKSKSRSQSRNDIPLSNPSTGSRPTEPASVVKNEEPPSQSQFKESAAANTESDTPPRKPHSGPRPKSKTHRATKSGNLSQSENEMSQRNRPRGPSRTNEAVGRGEEFQLWQNTRERMAAVLKSINETSRLTRDVAANDKSAAAKDKAGGELARLLCSLLVLI